ncbi:MAG: hypothetical protein PHW60_10460 [Kiritimatiellae bacterium]|nr:hypothetical protein [Kiritimatiellia bacterium]
MNINIKTVCVFLCVASLSCNVLIAGTNELWFARVDASFMREPKDLTPQQVCMLLEKESKKLDKSGRGVKIIWTLTPFKNEVEILHNSGAGFCGMSLIDILRINMQGVGMDCIVTEDVAIIGRRKYKFVSVALSGKCYDAKTGKSINTFQIESIPFSGVSSISTNGCYICALPCMVNVLENDDVMLPSGETFKTKKDFRVVAPGYKERTFSVDVFLPDKTYYLEVDIPLEPNSRKP